MPKTKGRSASVHPHVLRVGPLTLSAMALVVPQAVASGSEARSAVPDPTAPGPYRVGTATYDLGDSAFTDPASGVPVELAAVVHYPKNRGSGPHPLIIQLHGQWWTCADRAAEAAFKAGDDDAADKLGSWPCAAGVKPLPSERGYDYLGETLASDGFVVVSIRSNGINATLLGEGAAEARAALINKHLAMWRQLTTTGKGQLAGKFTDAATGRPEHVNFKHQVDLTKVGTMGHSRGGTGVMWHAPDTHRDQWPRGVKVKAVLGLAPAYIDYEGVDHSNFQPTGVSLAVLKGTCDGAVDDLAFDFVKDVIGKNKHDLYRFNVHGANHNFFNTQWSPRSGQVMAEDDAPPYGDPPRAGRCASDAGGSDRALTETGQRTVGAAYIVAFYRHALLGDNRFDTILTGARHPYASVTRVDVRADQSGAAS